jgi:hypothetical protein
MKEQYDRRKQHQKEKERKKYYHTNGERGYFISNKIIIRRKIE